MIIRNVTAILAAIFLVTVSTPSRANEFCEHRYCGQQTHVYHTHKSTKHRHKHVAKHRHKERNIIVVTATVITRSYNNLIHEAERYLGTNPTGWRHVWCGRFMAMIAPEKAKQVKNPNWARAWADLPGAHRYQGVPGEIVVLSRGSGGHIGVLKGYDRLGNPIVISGNHGRVVGVGVYSKDRVLAYVPA